MKNLIVLLIGAGMIFQTSGQYLKVAKLLPYPSLGEGLESDNGRSVNCKGTCPTGKCYARLIIQDQTFDCLPCSDCKMVIKNLKSEDSYEYQFDLEKIGQMFTNRLAMLHAGQEAKITNILMQHSENKEYIHFEYYIGDNENNLFSVGYVSEKASNGGPIIEVDCSGDCGQSSVLCTEVYNVRTEEVYCKCQSDSCKMKVTKG